MYRECVRGVLEVCEGCAGRVRVRFVLGVCKECFL